MKGGGLPQSRLYALIDMEHDVNVTLDSNMN
jgi:hypothetical protein